MNPEEPNPAQTTRIDELLTLVRKLEAKNQKPTFWDRPVVLTLIATIALTLITTWWNHLENRRQDTLNHRQAIYKDVFVQQQLALITSLPKAYELSGTLANSWLVHLLWLAEEKNKGKDARQDAIKQWQEEIQKLQAAYAKAPSIDGLIGQIKVIYACDGTRAAADQLNRTWRAFLKLHQDTVQAYNAKEGLPAQAIATAETARRQQLKTLQEQYDALIKGMGDELAGIRIGKLECGG